LKYGHNVCGDAPAGRRGRPRARQGDLWLVFTTRRKAQAQQWRSGGVGRPNQFWIGLECSDNRPGLQLKQAGLQFRFRQLAIQWRDGRHTGDAQQSEQEQLGVWDRQSYQIPAVDALRLKSLRYLIGNGCALQERE
jgi:hypothetical protein